MRLLQHHRPCRYFPRSLAPGLLTLLLCTLLTSNLRGDESGTALRLTNTGQNTEGLPTLRLDWDATSNATYLVQSATSLEPGAAWTTLDTVTPAGSVGSYQLQVVATDSTGLASPPATFYRLILPQPQLFTVEPAVITPGVPVDLYVLGQMLPTNAVLQINGVIQAGTVYQNSSTLVQPSFTPTAAGNYQVSLEIGSLVVSSFNVTCADALANPELVLQGPPQEPLASPESSAIIAFWLSKKGYDYYQAQSSRSVVNGTMNGPLNSARSDGGGATVGRANFDVITSSRGGGGGGGGIRANDNVVFDIQEGKKGLNAVNVKLARRASGGGEELPKESLEFNDGFGVSMPIAASRSDGGGATVGKAGARSLVDCFSGEVQESDVDLVIPGRGLDFVWARTYHSRLGRFGTATNGWTFSYDVHCAQNSSGGMDIYDGSGRKDTFSLGTNGLYNCAEFFREGALSNNTFTLTFADTGRWVFNPFDGTSTAGKLFQIITRNGDTMTLGYDTSGRLAQVVDDLGRTNTLSYNTAGQLASVTDFTGRSVTYQYYSGAKGDNGGSGDLKSVTSPPVTGTPNGNDFPSGKTTTYTYSAGYPDDRKNHLLLSVIDASGKKKHQYVHQYNETDFDFLRCISAQEGTNTPLVLHYQARQIHLPQFPGTATMQCVVNDPVGNVTEGYFDARGRCVLERDYTGRAIPGLPVSDTVNRPSGQVRATDPAYYETSWNWNNDSLCTLEAAPGGQQAQYEYQSDFDPSTTARKRADCRVVREIASSAVDLNGDGIPDAASRTWYYTYDPRFGSEPAARKDMLQWIKDSLHRRAPEGNGVAIKTKGTGADKNRISSGHGEENPQESVTFGREKLKATTKTQGDFNLSSGRLTNRRKGWDGLIYGRRVINKGWDGTIKGLVVPDGNGVAIQTKGTGADKNRTGGGGGSVLIFEDRWPYNGDLDFNDQNIAYNYAVSVTDPRGNVTTHTFDAKGNRVKVKFYWDRQSSAEEDFAYDTHGQLTAITSAPDANGRSRVDRVNYYTSGPQTGYPQQCIADAGAGGYSLTENYEYDARGNVTRVVDPRGNDWLYTYNALDQCVRVQSPTNLSARCNKDFAYDANDNLVQVSAEVRDAADNLTGTRVDRASYDGLDRLSEIALAVDASHALTNRFVYDGNNHCVQVLGGDAVSGADPHQTVAYQYDERRLLFSEIAAPGSANSLTNEFDYNANGKVKWFQVELYVEKMDFDGFDRPASVQDPMGNVTTFNFDANDNLKVIRLFGELNDVPGTNGNVRLAESSYQYDGLDRCVTAQDLYFNPATQSPIGSGKSTTTCAYAPNGECVSVTDPLGHTTTYGYDTACRPVSVTDALGNQQSVVLDTAGNPLVNLSSEIPAVGGKTQVFAVTNVYDSLNRRVSTTDSAGNNQIWLFGSQNRVLQSIDPRGTSSFYQYDLLDRCTLAVADLDRDGVPDLVGDITTTYTWSASSDLLLAVTDSQGNTTSYDYDSLGRCLAVAHADGTQEHLTWSPRSNLIQETDANGTTITNTFDLCDRLVHRDIAARNVLATTTFETFTYDGCHRLAGAANDNGTNAFVYDSLDDCVSETLNGLVTTSTYDALGNRLSLTCPGGRALAYTYDALNRCATVTDSGQLLASYAYDGPDRVSLINYGNGTRTQIAYDGFASPPNAQGDYGFGRIRRVRSSVVASGAIIDDRTFSYDQAQNKKSRNMTSPFTLGGAAQTMSFTYDPACRLVTATVATNGSLARLTTYGLDRMGNRTNVTGAASCSGDYTLSSAIPPADFQMNRYTATPCDSRGYDGNGNLVNRSSPLTGQTSYQYDYADRLVQAQVLDFSSGSVVITTSAYAYDALGRRIAKTVSSGGLPPVTTHYVYDVVTYRDGEDGAQRARAGSRVIEERSDGLVSATYLVDDRHLLGLRRGGQDYYFHTDDQDNALALTTTGGAVVERYDYDDYGAVTFLTSDGFPTTATSSAVGNPYLFHGLEWDGETGLLGNGGGSYFDPQTASTISGKANNIKIDTTSLTGNNPWSGGGGGGGTEMKNGTVKFFNDAKGFGMVSGGGGKASLNMTLKGQKILQN